MVEQSTGGLMVYNEERTIMGHAFLTQVGTGSHTDTVDVILCGKNQCFRSGFFLPIRIWTFKTICSLL